MTPTIGISMLDGWMDGWMDGVDVVMVVPKNNGVWGHLGATEGTFGDHQTPMSHWVSPPHKVANPIWCPDTTYGYLLMDGVDVVMVVPKNNGVWGHLSATEGTFGDHRTPMSHWVSHWVSPPHNVANPIWCHDTNYWYLHVGWMDGWMDGWR